jgi:uncharacterized alpha-E superfamily protein
MARNVERTENSARLIVINLDSTLENFNPERGMENYQWEEILEINGSLKAYRKNHDIHTQSVINYLSFSTENPNSIYNCVQIARDNAKTVRGMIPQDLWEHMNTFYLSLREAPFESWEANELNRFFQMAKDQALYFQGIVDAFMCRGDAYTFMKMGQNIERAEKTTSILSAYFNKSLEGALNKEVMDHHRWTFVLHAVGGYEAFLEKNKSFLIPEQVIKFLVFDESFPRSIRYSIDRLMYAINNLEHGRMKPYNRELLVAVGKLQAELKFTSIEEVLAQGAESFFEHLLHSCYQLNRLISKTYYLGE